jgi:hypothetical protein
MATHRDGKLVQTEVVDKGFSAEDRAKLMQRFQRIEQPKPPRWWKGAPPSNTVWLQTSPGSAVVCEVECSRVDPVTGKPMDPTYKSAPKK